MQENYFQFKERVASTGKIFSFTMQSGKYIFQNRNNTIRLNDVLPFLVFHYITNYNLDDLELFFKLAGFSAFREEELPSSIIEPINIDLPNKNYVYTSYFGGFTDEEEAKVYIETELGEGIISKYRTVKKNQLLQKKVQLEEQIANIEEELKNYTEPEETIIHIFK